MTLPAEKRRYTIQEYLDLEEKAVERHEFDNGDILMMSGGTYNHSRINTNLIGWLVGALRGKGCHPLDSNMRLRIANRPKYVYPDISVLCGEPQFDPDDARQTTILNPRLVVEVLSESTAAYDRGAKFDAYREIASLEQYVLVSQDQPLVETFRRQADGAWTFRVFKGLQTRLSLETLDVAIDLSEIYAGIVFADAV